MYVCDICEDRLCKDCTFGNPCLGCSEYDRTKDECKSNGACASAREEKHLNGEVIRCEVDSL